MQIAQVIVKDVAGIFGALDMERGSVCVMYSARLDMSRKQFFHSCSAAPKPSRKRGVTSLYFH